MFALQIFSGKPPPKMGGVLLMFISDKLAKGTRHVGRKQANAAPWPR